MKNRGLSLVLVLLAPILVAQGRYVRRVTSKLAEPTGERQGNVGSGKRLRLLIVGDSSAAGVGAKTQALALSGQLASKLAPHYQLSWRLIAKTGDTVQDVLANIESVSDETFDVAVVAVGVNDVTGRTSLKRWRANLEHLCKLLQSRFGVQQVLLTPVPPMQAFPVLPRPLRWYLGRIAALFNQSMQALTREHESWQCLQPDFPLRREFMATDGFHPSEAAYSLWADNIVVAIKRSF